MNDPALIIIIALTVIILATISLVVIGGISRRSDKYIQHDMSRAAKSFLDNVIADPTTKGASNENDIHRHRDNRN